MRCLKCHHEWWSSTSVTSCIQCGHVYVLWLNFKEWSAAHDKK